MSNVVSREEQIRQGLIKPRSNYTPAKPIGSFDFQDNDRGILKSAVDAAGEMMTHRQMTHIVRSDDTAVTQAYASLIYSAAYAFAAALITGGIILIAWIQYGADDNGGDYMLAWLLLWGLSILAALIINRSQGLHYSSSGIAHHEISSREAIARYVIDKHVELIEKRWKIDKR
jgi:hypothetical protein